MGEGSGGGGDGAQSAAGGAGAAGLAGRGRRPGAAEGGASLAGAGGGEGGWGRCAGGDEGGGEEEARDWEEGVVRRLAVAEDGEAGAGVLAEVLAVVGGDEEEGRAGGIEAVELVHQAADLGIEVG